MHVICGKAQIESIRNWRYKNNGLIHHRVNSLYEKEQVILPRLEATFY